MQSVVKFSWFAYCRRGLANLCDAAVTVPCSLAIARRLKGFQGVKCPCLAVGTLALSKFSLKYKFVKFLKIMQIKYILSTSPASSTKLSRPCDCFSALRWVEGSPSEMVCKLESPLASSTHACTTNILSWKIIIKLQDEIKIVQLRNLSSNGVPRSATYTNGESSARSTRPYAYATAPSQHLLVVERTNHSYIIHIFI